MTRSDLLIEVVAAKNYHPDQVWARKLNRTLALQQYNQAFIEQAPPKEIAYYAVEFSRNKNSVRMNNLFATIGLAEKNITDRNPEVYILKKPF